MLGVSITELKGKKWGVLPLSFITLICLLFCVFSITKPLSDYANYYYGSKFLINGSFNTDIYEPYLFNLKIRASGATDVFANYTPVPPFTALFYVPFVGFDASTSKIIFNLFSLLFFIGSLYRITKHLQVNTVYLWLIPLLFFIPFRSNFFFGQTYLLVISLLAEGYIAFDKKKYLLSSLLWAIVILLKIFPLIIFLFLFFTKKYKQSIYLLITLMVLVLFSCLFIPWNIWSAYLFEILPRLAKTEINDTFTYKFQSAHILLKNIFVKDDLLNPFPLLNSSLVFDLLSLAFTVFLLFVMVSVVINQSITTFSKFCAVIYGSLLISGYGNSYSLLLLIFPVLAIVKENSSSGKKLFLACVLLACNIPIHLFQDWNVFFQYPRLYLLLVAFIVFIAIGKIKINFKITLLSIAVVCFLKYLIVTPKTERDSYYLKKEEALLIYDYKFDDQELTVKFLTDRGRGIEEKHIPVTDSAIVTDSIYIKENQIFLKDKQITFSKDRKKKAMLLNKDEIIYLSDKNRGIGFYTLRKFKI